jgi:hypothetical protein
VQTIGISAIPQFFARAMRGRMDILDLLKKEGLTDSPEDPWEPLLHPMPHRKAINHRRQQIQPNERPTNSTMRDKRDYRYEVGKRLRRRTGAERFRPPRNEFRKAVLIAARAKMSTRP